jgi:soluble lytic murein transglycosylase-like protein
MLSATRKRSSASAPGARERRWALALLLASLALFVATSVTQGPKVARQVWTLVGVKKVESHRAIVCAAAAESGVDPCLMAGIMYVESRGRIDAVSDKGALGLFQLVPAAASDAAKRLHLPEPTRDDLLTDPLLNARLGAVYLAWLYRNEGPNWERVLVAYNAGRGKLAKWLKDAGGWDAWRKQHEEKGDSGALVYAQEVLEFAERFRERDVIVHGADDAAVSKSVEPAAR